MTDHPEPGAPTSKKSSRATEAADCQVVKDADTSASKPQNDEHEDTDSEIDEDVIAAQQSRAQTDGVEVTTERHLAGEDYDNTRRVDLLKHYTHDTTRSRSDREDAFEPQVDDEDNDDIPHSNPRPTTTLQDTTRKRARSQDDEDTGIIVAREVKRAKDERQASTESDMSQTSAKSSDAIEDLSSSISKWSSFYKVTPSNGEEDKDDTVPSPQDSESDGYLNKHDVKVSIEVAGSSTEVQSTPRSHRSSSSSAEKYTIAITKSNITERQGLMKFLRSKCKIQDKIDRRVEILCVGKVTTTSKLLLAVAKGIPVVSDDWIVKSAKEGAMLDPDDFMIRDEQFKNQHGRFLADTAGKPSDDIFSRRLIYITPALKKLYGSGYEDIKQVCVAAGAPGVISQPAREVLKRVDEYIVVGLMSGDLDAITLHDFGHPIYDKNFLSGSVLRGKVVWNEMHRIAPAVSKPDQMMPPRNARQR